MIHRYFDVECVDNIDWDSMSSSCILDLVCNCLHIKIDQKDWDRCIEYNHDVGICPSVDFVRERYAELNFATR